MPISCAAARSQLLKMCARCQSITFTCSPLRIIYKKIKSRTFLQKRFFFTLSIITKLLFFWRQRGRREKNLLRAALIQLKIIKRDNLSSQFFGYGSKSFCCCYCIYTTKEGRKKKKKKGLNGHLSRNKGPNAAYIYPAG